ncbi:hypothetical protein PALB_19740 [Pseudoalteromonas luteoviolacea B = ATCC 29581]|nr:hypothetical protein PALB_19740 [Pseudoalteromonas luteoviolacea B = ATCC 29581]
MTRRVYQALFIACLIVCTLLFLREINSSAIKISNADKFAHALIFFGLAFVQHHAFRLPVWLHLLLLTFYGALVEVVQSFVPYREASLGDLLADVAGAFLYFIVLYVWQKLSPKQQTS